MVELFTSRPDVYAVQYRDTGEPEASRQYKYRPIHEPVTVELIGRHLKGEITLGFYTLDQTSNVKWICFDLDTRDEKQAHKILTVINRKGISRESIIAESSGAKGFHIWILLEPTSAKVARTFAYEVLREAKLAYAEKIEVFPKQDRLTDEDSLGNLVKLPLGKHLRTGQRAMLIDPSTLTPIDWTDLREKFQSMKPALLPETETKTAAGPVTAATVTLPECATAIPEGLRDFYFYSLLNAIKKKYPSITSQVASEVLEPLRQSSNDISQEPFTERELADKIRRFIDHDKARFPSFTLCKYGKQAATCPCQQDEYCVWISEGKKPVELTELGRKFLEQQDLSDRTADVLDSLIVGERELKMLCFFLCLGSAVHETPSGLIIIDRLGGGKSHCEKNVVELFPSERVSQPTSYTEQALNYLAENYSGRIVRIDEIFGLEDVLKDLRVWMTNGRLERISAPTSDDKERGQGQAITLAVEGCPVFITSTTKSVDEEYGSRNWVAHVDVSTAQSVRIHARQAIQGMVPGEIFTSESDARDFLSSIIKWMMENAKPVLVPYSYTFPSEDPRTRRDRARFQMLIQAVANWYQLQREIYVAPNGQEYIIASPRDLEIALQVARPYLIESLTSLDAKAIQIIQVLAKSDHPLSIRELVEEGKIADKTVRRRIGDLLGKGYVVKEESKRPEKFTLTEKAKHFGADVKIEILAEEEGREFIEKLKQGMSPENLMQEIRKFEINLGERLLAAELSNCHTNNPPKTETGSDENAILPRQNDNSQQSTGSVDTNQTTLEPNVPPKRKPKPDDSISSVVNE
jgi:predicted transcriptional regulator